MARYNNLAFWSLFMGILLGFLKLVFVILNNDLILNIIIWISYLFYILAVGLGIYSLIKKEEKSWLAYLAILLAIAINYKLFI